MSPAYNSHYIIVEEKIKYFLKHQTAMSSSLTTEYPFSRYVPAVALTGERLGDELEPSYGVERASPTIGLLPMDAR